MKNYKILKFGGSSIANADCITRVGKIILSQNDKPFFNIIVVSALGEITNKLSLLVENRNNEIEISTGINELKNHHQSICVSLRLDLHDNLNKIWTDLNKLLSQNSQISEDELKDEVLSVGEIVSSQIISGHLNQIGISSNPLDARKLLITDDHFGNAFVHYQRSFNRIRTTLKDVKQVQVITGFIGATDDGRTTTLGRSGSDYSAAIIGAAVNASEIQIWTDVDGILTADPVSVENAKTISHLNYEEAMELAHGGAKVIFPPTMIPALYKNIPIRIKNTFNSEHEGTLITKQKIDTMENAVGISSRSGVCLFRLQGAGMIGLFGLIGRIFTSLASQKINIILVSQVFSEHSVCFVINSDHAEKAENLLKKEFEFELNSHIIDKIIVEKEMSLIALVGEGMRHIPGISGKLFNTLGREKINVIAIAQGSSERNISFIVDDHASIKTMRVLHHEFFDKKKQTTAIILAGAGVVGAEVLNILSQQKNSKLHLTGVCNSTNQIINPDGIVAKNAKTQLKNGKIKTSLIELLNSAENYKNKIFIDCTTSNSLINKYETIFSNGFSIVAANKKANTQSMKFYSRLRNLSFHNKIQFRYETNVGAGLPVISTINSLLNSGDKIHKIEGVLSGTLSYLFNNFDGRDSFSNLVKTAQKKGYTEPDPREDLDGMDVARKCLILAREIGYDLELSDIKVENLLPEKSEDCKTTTEFLTHLSNFDNLYLKKLNHAKHNDKKLCYIGKIEGEKAEVSLKAIDNEHPFYHLQGSENIISITTTRYLEQPLVIRGHGAGAAVTAGGVIADLMEIIGNSDD